MENKIDFQIENIDNILKVRKSYLEESYMEKLLSEVTVLSSKGQIVLPKLIRETLSLKTGSKLITLTDGKNILLKPIEEPDLEDFSKLMNKSRQWAKSVGMTENDVNEAIKVVRRKKHK